MATSVLVWMRRASTGSTPAYVLGAFALLSCSSCDDGASSPSSPTPSDTRVSFLPFLDQYSGQSTDQLIALEGQYRVDSIVLAFEEAIQRKEARLGEDALTGSERIVLAVEAMEREVNNGGYHQFFTNSSREYAAILVESLESINCPHAARLAQRAIDALRLDGPVTPESIEAAIGNNAQGLDEALNSVDDEYYSNPEPIADNLFQFIKNHAAEIRP